MYSLDELFRGSIHKASVFMPETVKWLENRIAMKPARGGEVPYVKCIIRNKEVRLTPEEAVRQMYVYELIHKEGYPAEQIQLEYAVHFGCEVKRADIVIFEKKHPDSEYIIVEVKKPKLLEGKAQLKSYCNATGALIGVWINGEITECYHRKDPNYFEKVDHLPKAYETLKDVIGKRKTIADLERDNRLKDGKITLKDIITDIEDEVLANAGVNVFNEVFKLIFTKLYDEMKSIRNENRLLEFGNYGDTDEDLKENIQALFDLAKEHWQGVFVSDEKITLNPSHLAVCVASLQNVKLFNSNLDVVDDAFEYLMTKSQKGEKGQFFTPRYVIDMCVKMLNPQEHETMIDTAAGSCGFTVHTMFYVWGQIYDRLGIPRKNMFTAEKKPEECTDYVRKKVFAIDFDAEAVRVARTLNLIAGDGQTNVMHLNTLDYMHWDEVTRSQDWIDTYNDGWKGLRGLRAAKNSNMDFMFDIVMANPPFAGDVKEGKIISQYELAKDKKGKHVSRIGRDILFIERNLQFLKPGGRMAIILPQGRFNNSSDKYIRDFIAERCRILAVIGLHENVFKPHTGTKTSVLFVQKWDDELCPKVEDYPVFFATMRKPGKDNSGEKVYRKNPDGSVMLDGHNHPIVEHDLYNHEGMTEDGIAEAFREFAVREGLSFFGGARFDEARYEALRSGLEISEVMLSEIDLGDRMDAEFFSKSSVKTAHRLEKVKTLKLGEIASTVASAFYPAATQLYSIGDFPFVRCVDCVNYPVITKDQDAAFEKIPRSFAVESKGISILKKNEIVITKVGTPCYASIVDDYDEVALSRTVLGLKDIHDIDPHYLLAFLRCSYGFGQLFRHREQTIQYQLTLPRVKDVDVFIPSEGFQKAISDMVKRYRLIMSESTALYAAAQTLLSSQLGQVPQNSRSTTVRSLSEAFSAGRLDAEYFMPKYDGYLQLLNSFDTTSIPAEYNVFKNSGTNYSEKSHDVGVIKTKQLTNRGINTDGVESWFDIDTCTASTFLQTGDVVFASMGVGSLGKVSMFTYEGSQKFVTDSTLRIYRAKNGTKVLPEVLCLFLQSEIGQEMIYRYVVGSTGIINIYDKDIASIPIPILDSDTQTSIAHCLQRSFTLRKKSDSLIRSAVHAVELAVESSEQSALTFINSKEEFLPS